MVDAINFVPLLSALACFFLFSYVHGQRRRSSVNNAFLLFVFAEFCLCVAEFLIRLPLPMSVTIPISKAAMAICLCLGFLLLNFTYAFLSRRRDSWYYVLLALAGASSIASFTIDHHRLMSSPSGAADFMAPTVAYIPLFATCFIPPLLAGVFLSNEARRGRSSARRKQSAVLVLGMIASAVLATLLLVVAPLFLRSFAAYRFSSLVVVVQMGFVYLGVARYGLMTVDVRQIEAVSGVLFRNLRDGVIVTGRDGSLVQMNRAASRLVDRPEEIKSVTEVRQRFPELDFDSDSDSAQCSHELDGEERTVAVSQSSLDHDGSGLGRIIMIRDMTEQVRLEEGIARKNQIESLGQLAGGIAHDFNNQLFGIMGCADMLRTDLADNPSLYDLADLIVASARRSSRLTNQLLAFAQRGKFQCVAMNLHDVVRDVGAMLERSIDKRIRIPQHLDAQMPIILGDPSQLNNVLLNIALNARDAMPEGGELVFSTRDTVLEREFCSHSSFEIRPGKYVEVSIKDTGTGMTPEILDRVFEPFFTTKGRGKGSGMGLAAAYGTVRNHSGAIDIESEIGSGTTVRVLFPLSGEEVAAVRGADSTPKIETECLRIMFVDDEDVVSVAATEMLKRAEHSVVAFTNGNDAVEHFRKMWKEIDVVILDLVMPGLSGYETFTALRRVNPDVKVLVSSGYSVDGEAQKMLDEGAAGFLQKPFEAADLLPMVCAIQRSHL